MTAVVGVSGGRAVPSPDTPGTFAPGEWTPTGWGAQHRVRRSDPVWTELVCGELVCGESARVETSRIDPGAGEVDRCQRCAALPDLGPLRRGALGEVRRSPEGLVAVCHRTRIGNGWRWKVIGEDPEPGGYGWRDDWQVASWTPVGTVPGLGVGS